MASRSRLPQLGRRLGAHGQVTFYDELAMTATLDCRRAADWNVHETHQTLKYSATFSCIGPSGPLPAVAAGRRPSRAAKL